MTSEQIVAPLDSWLNRGRTITLSLRLALIVRTARSLPGFETVRFMESTAVVTFRTPDASRSHEVHLHLTEHGPIDWKVTENELAVARENVHPELKASLETLYKTYRENCYPEREPDNIDTVEENETP